MSRTMRIPVFCLLACCVGRAQDAAALFESNCASCHRADSGTGAPLPEVLRQMPSQRILEALESGKMQAMAASLTATQRAALAKYLGVEGAGAMPQSAYCSAPAQAASPA